MDGTAQDPALEARVGRLEVDMHDVKSTLGRLEPLIVSIHAQMPYLATKAELEGLRGEVKAEFAAVRGEVKAEFAAVRGEVRAELEGLRGEIRAGLAGKPSILGMWMMGATLFALVVAGMTAGAAYLPILARAFHAGP